MLRLTPEKTAGTSGMTVAIDLRECPMVMDELSHIPPGRRTGPLIVSERTGLPYARTFSECWRRDANAAGVPKTVWNRDLRAGGVTEAREAGAPIDDVKKVVGHTAGTRTTARVYDRDSLEAARRVSRARVDKRRT